MRKKPNRLIMLFSALLSVFLLLGLFSACEKLVSVTSVEMKEGQSEITVEVGKFDFSDYTIVVNYDDGTSTEEELKEEYVPTEYQMQLYSEGTHEILVKAHMRECKFTLNVLRHSFSDVVLKNITAPYTGEPYSACVEGVLPAGTKITYSNGNSFTNVGTYECNAILTCEGYVTKHLKCTLEITPIDYDMEGVSFAEEYVFDYDGKSKTVALNGELPKGVSVSYTIDGEKGNGAVNANEEGYTVEANFFSDDPNYNDIKPMRTVLKIKKAVVSTKEIGLALKTAVQDGTEYDGTAHEIVYGDKLPDGVSSVAIEYYDANGERIAKMIDAGEYTVKMILSATDEENHVLSEGTYSESYTIRKKLIVSNDIYFDDGTVFYDGKPHTLTATGEHIEDLPIVYEVEGQTGTEFTEVGTYDFKATIPEDANYEYEKVVREATLTIVAVESGYGAITDSKIKREIYTGEEFGWDFSFIPECLDYDFILKDANGETVERPVTVGLYTYTVYFFNTRNYTDVPSSAEYYLEITPATMVIPDIYSKEHAFEYTGNGVEYPATTPSEDITVQREYIGRETAPVAIGTYDVRLTFRQENYFDVVKTTKLIISKAIIYDNVNLDALYSGLIDGSKPYNDGNPVDLSAYENKEINAKCIARGDEIPEGLYYYGENGADIPVKVSLRYYGKDSAEQADTIYEVGEYEIDFEYSLVDTSETGYYVHYDGERKNFTVTKAELTLVCGVDYKLGIYPGKFYEQNWSEVRPFDWTADINIQFVNELLGNLYSGKEIICYGYSAFDADGVNVGKPSKVGNYKLVYDFRSAHYEVSAETTWEIRHTNLDNFHLTANMQNQVHWYVYDIADYAVPYNMQINGYVCNRQYSNLTFDYNTGIVTAENYSNSDITITYKIYYLKINKLGYGNYSAEWDKNPDGTLKAHYRTNEDDVGVGAFYFVFTVTNGAGESKTFYGDLPSETNGYKKTTILNQYYCAVKIESENDDID